MNCLIRNRLFLPKRTKCTYGTDEKRNELAFVDTIDIVKYESNNTVHLPVNLLLDLPVPTGSIWCGGDNLMWNNEQLPVPGVPFPEPEQAHETSLTYGIIEGTNIGYVYLYIEAIKDLVDCMNYEMDPQFYEAILSLIKTEGLIIDIRMNFGGWALYDQAEALLFNQYMRTLDDATRCNQSDFTLCHANSEEYYAI
jgi:hypothetical protein